VITSADLWFIDLQVFARSERSLGLRAGDRSIWVASHMAAFRSLRRALDEPDLGLFGPANRKRSLQLHCLRAITPESGIGRSSGVRFCGNLAAFGSGIARSGR